MQTGYVGIDLGGTGAKAGLFDEHGRLVRSSGRKYTATSREAGRAEIPIGVIYDAAREACREACADSGFHTRAAAISSQGQTFVSLDAQDQPLHDAIIWYDGRATEQAARLEAEVNKLIPRGADRPGITIIATVSKIVWLREKQPDLMRHARRFLLLPDYLSYRLAGRAVIDPSTACSTGLYVENTGKYCREVFAAAGIAENQVAQLGAFGAVIGGIARGAAREWGLAEDTQLVVGTNDQYAGALGAGNCREGIVTETSGTCLGLVTLKRRLPSPMPTGIFGGMFPIPGFHFALAFTKTAGVVMDWFKRECAPGLSLAELDRMAAGVSPGSDNLTFLPHFDGTISPVPNQAARGAIYGLTLQHTRSSIYRAILESLAFCLRENLELFEKNGFPFDTIRSLGGGANSDIWLQIKADATGRAIEKPAVTEAAIKGAAMLAAYGMGAFPSLAECSAAFYQSARRFDPNPAHRAAYDAAYRRYRELKRACYASFILDSRRSLGKLSHQS